MERIFWAECCGCHGKFYGSYRELRHTGVKLMCPFCRREFLPRRGGLARQSLDRRDGRAHPTGRAARLGSSERALRFHRTGLRAPRAFGGFAIGRARFGTPA
jgi:hypothetical protein